MLEVKKLAQAVVLTTLSFSSASFSQEFVPAEELESVVTQQATSIPADAGVQAITEVAEQPYVQTTVPAEFISAEDQLYKYMTSKGWDQNWDSKKKRMFVIKSESFDVEDPSYDTDFISKRSLYATMASMGAKVKIVEFMRTQMSATDQLSAPGTDVYEALNKEYIQQENKISAQQAKLVKLMAEVDATEAQTLEGVTWDDLGKEAMIAAIKKLDSSFDAGKIEEGKRKAFEKAKARFEEASAEMDALNKQAQAMSKSTTTRRSSVEALANAPVMGATLLAQAESWNEEEEKYQVAVLLVWSKKLEQAASSILTGSPVNTKPKKGKSVGEWARSQDLATMVGSRQFVDKDGQRWFVGAYGSLLEGSSSAQRSAKGRADLFARKEAAVSLFADLETHKQAEIAAETRSGGLGQKDTTNVATSFAETTRQSIENRQISGMSQLLSKTVKHPVSGQKLYVVLYGISANAATNAMAAEASAYKNSISAAKSNAYQQGVKQSYDQTLNSAKNDTTSLHQGQQAGKASLSQQPTPANAQPAVVNVQTSKGNPRVSEGRTESQTLFSAPDVDDDDF